MVSDKMSRSTNDVKKNIITALKQFERGSLFENAINLFDALGYDISLQNRLDSPSLAGLSDEYGLSMSAEKVMSDDILTLELLFQLRKEEITKQISLFDTRKVNNKLIESYLFFAVELKKKNYTRSQLAQITREFNRVFPMPVMLLFKHGNRLTLSAIDRRINKRNADRDVLERITLIKDINIAQVNRAQLEILYDLSFDELYRLYKFTSFVELHDAWQKTLDISQLNKRFYDKLFTWYLWAKKEVCFPKPDGEDLSDDSYRSISVIRLLTRLIFVWFVREKGLVPEGLFEEHYLRNLLKNADDSPFSPDSRTDSTYYRAILQNLFFATLNTPMARDAQTDDERRQFIDLSGNFRGRSQQYTDQTKYRYAEYFINPDRALAEFEQVPFLNGGLFECLDYPADSTTGTPERRYDGFSSTEAKRAFVPNALFFGEVKGLDLSDDFDNDRKRKSVDVQGLIQILSAYKFTITENTPLEQEIALDPELLGKVFENLLASYNPETGSTARKQTGSFYTPREIVNYMVDESLKAYIRDNLAEANADDRLDTLFSYTTDENPFSPDETKMLIRRLSVCKILDPACGSGAFPMGVLHRMVHLLGKLDPNNRQWKETLLNTAEEDLRKANELRDEVIREQTLATAEQRIAYIRDSFDQTDHEFDYTRKLFLIEECIHGVDKQQIAVQIAKLRFFISLIVEQRVDNSQPNRNVLSMPNLETKFVAADTLISLDKPKGQLTIGTDEVKKRRQELDEVRKRIFSIKRFSDKKKLRVLEAEKRQNLRVALIQSGFVEKAASQAADWNPFDVMHSSPFFDAELMFGEDLERGFDIVIGNPPWGAKLTPQEKEILKKNYPQIDSSTPNSFAYFIGWALSYELGILSFVLPDSILIKDFAKTRQLIKGRINEVIWYENAGVPEEYKTFVYVDHDVCVMTLLAIKTQKLRYTLNRYDKKQKTVISEEFEKLKSQIILEEFDHAFNLIAQDDDFRVLNKISRFSSLEEITQCHEGIHTGNSRDLLFVSSSINKYCKPLYYGASAGDNINNYVSNPFGWYVDYRNTIVDKSQGYYASLRDERIFKLPKIYITRTGSPYKAFLDQDTYASNNFFSLQFKDYSKNNIDSLKEILPFIVSKIAQYFIRTFAAPRLGATFVETKITHLLKFRVPVSSPVKYIFIKIVDYIILTKNYDSNISSFFERLLDAMVYELYFPEELKAAKCDVLKYLEDLPDISDLNQIRAVYEQLSDSSHPVSVALFKMDSVEEIRIIEGKA